MNKRKFRPIIIAGGIGKRLWPISTEDQPKQFVPFFNKSSLFDLCLQRVNQRDLFKKPIIVTSHSFTEHIEQSLNRTGVEFEQVIFEPECKNTFSAICLAVLLNQLRNVDEDYFVLPSDHYMTSNKSFYETCSSVQNNPDKNGLTLFGVKPDKPSAEFGYISYRPSNKPLKIVKSFIEKPSVDEAKRLIKQPNTFWNAGIFCFNGNWLTESIKKDSSTKYHEIKNLTSNQDVDQAYFFPEKKEFSLLEDISFDKAFVERNENNSVVKLDAGWSDLGSWQSLGRFHKEPEKGMTLFSKISPKKINKPWGFFEILFETDFSKVKLLTIRPWQKLSLQAHRFRSEKWFVIQGEACVRKGDTDFFLKQGESIEIELNEKHRLENNADEILEIIEIQSGTYFGEDDITRYEDIYGRTDLQ